MKEDLTAFEQWNVRRIFDEKTETWYFSIVDIVSILTDQKDLFRARNYWYVLKNRLKKEGSEVLTKCKKLKITGKDNRKFHSDVADAETLLRLVQSIPSPKAEPIKLWLARVGYERIKEMEDPEAGIARLRDNWRKQGRSEEWINQRILSIKARNDLTDFWSGHGITEKKDFAALTGITHKEWTGMTVRQHKDLKGLKSQNLRDHMNDAELVLTMLAEIATRRIAEGANATGYGENADAAKQGGGVAKKAREELEAKSGKSVISNENFLPPKKTDG